MTQIPLPGGDPYDVAVAEGAVWATTNPGLPPGGSFARRPPEVMLGIIGSAAHRGVLRYVGRYAKRSLVDDLARGVERHDLTDGAGRRPKNEISCADGRWSFEQSYRPCALQCKGFGGL